jgi:hypothetical protein
VALEQLLALPAQALQHLAQALEAVAQGALVSAPIQVAQGALQVAILDQLIRHGLHQVIGVEGIDLLGAIPLVVAVGVTFEHGRAPFIRR